LSPRNLHRKPVTPVVHGLVRLPRAARRRLLIVPLLLCGLTLVAPNIEHAYSASRAGQLRQRAATRLATTNASPTPTPTTIKTQLIPVSSLSDPPPPPPPQRTQSTPAETTQPSTGSAAAAPDVEEEVDPEDVIRVNSNLVTVPASVVDRQGKAITDLKVEDFELRVDNQPKPISELSRSESPVRMALLFDNSSSLTEAREFEKQAAERFFQSVMRPMDQAAIYSVSTVPSVERSLTSDVQSLVRTIEHFSKPEGATALFDAIAQAAAYLRPEQGRKVIVVVSDGADTISDLDFNTTLQRVLGADCQIYAVQTSHTENPNLRNVAAERYLQEFTSQTGGAVYVPRGTDDLDAAFAQISADLAQQYVLSYYPQDDHNDGRFRSIGLRVATRPDLRVRARKGYYALPGQKQAWTPSTLNRGGGNESASPQPTETAKRETSPPSSNKAGEDAAHGPVPVKVSVATGNVETDRLVKPVDDAAQRGTTGKPSGPSSTPQAQSSPAPSQSSGQNQEQKSGAATPVSGGVLNGKAIRLPRPLYPAAARPLRASGAVNVEVLIDENGNVTSARAISGHPLLHSAAVQAARQAKFSPTTLSGQPVKVTGVIAYSFTQP
jgi:Ca-activated chloride channel family protein